MQLQLKTKKDKKFVVDEEWPLCCSSLHVSQDPMIENGQKFTMFWDRVQNHFNELCLTSYIPRFARSLKTKWGIIKHDITKFIGNYIVVLTLLWIKDMFWRYISESFKLVQNKASKTSSFHIPSCLVCFERHTSVGRHAKKT
jgi:hypothetical protein